MDAQPDLTGSDVRFDLVASGHQRPFWQRCPWRVWDHSVLLAPQTPGFHLLLKGQEPVLIAPGSLGIVASGTVHAYTVDQHPQSMVRWIHVRYPAVGHRDLLTVLDLPAVVRGAAGAELAAALTAVQAGAGQTHPLLGWVRTQSAGLALLACLLRLPGVLPAADRILRHLAQLLPVVRYIREHLADDIQVSDLAGILGCSPASAHRRFRTLAGTSPMRFVWHQRLDHARRLLRDGADPVQTVAHRCGFTDPFHFSRSFKRRFGCNPTTYRQRSAIDRL